MQSEARRREVCHGAFMFSGVGQVLGGFTAPNETVAGGCRMAASVVCPGASTCRTDTSAS